MKVYISEHDEAHTWPALQFHVVGEGKASGPFVPHTRAIRLHADDDCLIAIGSGEPTDLPWVRLAADVTEWFEVMKDPRNVRVWVKAVLDED